MQEKHERFAHEYAIDGNATKAAIRAGYSESRARQTGSDLIRRPDVRALVNELQEKTKERLGITHEAFDGEIQRVYERALKGTPRSYRDVLVRDESGEVIMVPDLPAAVRALELRAKLFGLLVERSEVDATVTVAYTLHLDRELEEIEAT